MGSHWEHLDRLTPFAAHVSFGLNEVDDTYRRVSGMQEIDSNDPLYRIISQIEFMVRNDIEYESEHDSKCARTAGLTEISDNMAAAGSTEGAATKRLLSQSAEQSPVIDRAAPRATSRPRDPARANEEARPSAAAIEAIERLLDRINSDEVQGLIHRAEAHGFHPNEIKHWNNPVRYLKEKKQHFFLETIGIDFGPTFVAADQAEKAFTKLKEVKDTFPEFYNEAYADKWEAVKKTREFLWKLEGMTRFESRDHAMWYFFCMSIDTMETLNEQLKLHIKPNRRVTAQRVDNLIALIMAEQHPDERMIHDYNDRFAALLGRWNIGTVREGDKPKISMLSLIELTGALGDMMGVKHSSFNLPMVHQIKQYNALNVTDASYMKDYIDTFLGYLNRIMQERCKRMMLCLIDSEISRGLRGEGTEAAEDTEVAFSFLSQVCYFRQIFNLRGERPNDANVPAPRGCGIYASHPLRSCQGLEIEQAIGSVGETLEKAGNKIVRKMSDHFEQQIAARVQRS